MLQPKRTKFRKVQTGRNRGLTQRGNKVIYDRANSSFATIQTSTIDWKEVFEGTDWFHWTGITPAISQGAADACLEAIQAAKVVPLIALTGFFNSNDPLKADLPDDADGVELSWKDDNVSFEFAALDFTAPNQNRYMYKLEGFDEDWIDLGTRRRITYTDLGDGQFQRRGPPRLRPDCCIGAVSTAPVLRFPAAAPARACS